MDDLKSCLPSLAAQTTKATVIVVDNGSVDSSVDFVKTEYPAVDLVCLPKNRGFAGGVNAGIVRARELGVDAVALFNNDAVADPKWLAELEKVLDKDSSVGIVTGKLLSADGKTIDSTGDFYTSWGLPYPRGRGETGLTKYDHQTDVFGASGGASLYRMKMLDQIGLFDEDFFAYYEDVDISWRARLAGWKIQYAPKAVARHGIGNTSARIKGFTTFQTLKNLPLLALKNVPGRLYVRLWPRFFVAHLLFSLRALSRGQITPVVAGIFMAFWLLPKKVIERRRIMRNRTISIEEANRLLIHDLPPNATALRKLRSIVSLGRVT